MRDAGTSLEQAARYRRMAEEGALRVRLWLMLKDDLERLEAAAPRREEVTPYLVIGGIKGVMDGALGSRSAWMLEPYADAPEQTGSRLLAPDTLDGLMKLALRGRLQMAVHAIGDRANRTVLDLSLIHI